MCLLITYHHNTFCLLVISLLHLLYNTKKILSTIIHQKECISFADYSYLLSGSPAAIKKDLLFGFEILAFFKLLLFPAIPVRYRTEVTAYPTVYFAFLPATTHFAASLTLTTSEMAFNLCSVSAAVSPAAPM